jgi:hypothetical protein
MQHPAGWRKETTAVRANVLKEERRPLIPLMHFGIRHKVLSVSNLKIRVCFYVRILNALILHLIYFSLHFIV